MPANTPVGYPYPLPTEPVAEGAAAIRALAEKIDATGGVHLIEAKTLAAAGVIAFASIPQIYRDLLLRVRARSAYAGGAEDSLTFTWNNYGGGAYNTQRFSAIGAVAQASALASQGYAVAGVIPAGTADGNLWGHGEITMEAYRETTYAYWISRINNGGGAQWMNGGTCWGVAGPVTALSVGAATGGQLAAGSKIALYGIK